jgi:hypothetical protein
MNRDERRRLARLEERAAKRSQIEMPPGTTRYGRPVPYYNHEQAALKKSLTAWRELMLMHGWSDDEIDEELAYERLVAERIEDANLDDLEEMADRINFMHVHGTDERYPGPFHWETGDVSALPHPMPGSGLYGGERGS